MFRSVHSDKGSFEFVYDSHGNLVGREITNEGKKFRPLKITVLFICCLAATPVISGGATVVTIYNAGLYRKKRKQFNGGQNAFGVWEQRMEEKYRTKLQNSGAYMIPIYNSYKATRLIIEKRNTRYTR